MKLTNRWMWHFTIAALITAAGCGEKEAEKPVNLEFGVNLLKNPSFEVWQDSLPDGWRGKAISEASTDSSFMNVVQPSSNNKKSGEYSCYFMANENTNTWIALMQVVPVVPGYDLVISSHVKSVGLRRNIREGGFSNMYAIFLDEDGNRVADSERYADMMTNLAIGNMNWHEERNKMMVPEGARYAEVGIISTMFGSIYFDDLKAYIRDHPPWVKKETKFIDFHWLPGKPLPDSSLARERDLIESYAELLKMKKPTKKIKYYYYTNEEDFKEINLTQSYYQGVKWEQREIHTMHETEDLAVTHMLIYDYGFPPVSLAKGAVFYLRASKHEWNPHMKVKEALMNYKLPALHNTIGKDVFHKFEPGIIVPAWASFCTHLINEHGIEKFLEFYAECDGVETPDVFADIFEKYYDEEFDKADQRWRLFVMRYLPDSESRQLP